MRINWFRCALFLLPAAAAWGQAVTITTGPNLGTWPLGDDEVALTATGGNGSFTWAYVSGALPPGLSIRTDMPSYFPASASAGLIGIATTPGSYNFTLSATSGTSSTSLAFTLKITGLTLKDGYNLPDAFVSSSYNYQMSASQNAGTVTWTPTGGVPPGMTLSPTGLLSGTPSAAASYNVTFTLTDGTDTYNRSVGLNVSAVQITSPGLLPNATQNGSYIYTLAASGGTGPYTFATPGGLPNGLTLSAGGVISGTVNTGESKYNFNVTVTDTQSHSYTKNVAIPVLGTPENIPQLLPYGNLDDCTIGQGCSRGIGIYSGGTPAFVWNVTGLPPGMSFRSGSGNTVSFIAPGDLEIWGAPTALGTYPLTVTATDSNGLSTTQVFNLKVSALNLNTGLPNGTAGTPYTGTFRIVGGVPPYTAALQSERNAPGRLPTGTSLSGLTVSGTPQESGSFNPLFLFTDSSSTANTLTLTQYPYFNDASGTVTVNVYNTLYATQGSSYSLQLGACCVSSYAWSFTGTLPPGLTLSASGLLSGTPTVSSTYTFQVQATQTGVPGNFGLRQLTMVVTPITVTTGYSLPYGNVNVVYSQTLVANNGSTPYTWSLAPGYYLPAGLSLNATTGVLSGTPQQPGGYYFIVLVSDSSGHVTSANFNLNVYPFGGVPPLAITTGANLGTSSIGEVQTQLVASGGTGVYTWSLTAGALPPGLALRTDTPAWFASNAHAGIIGLATTPNPTPGTSYSFTLQVQSGSQTVSQTFSMRITGLASKESACYQLPDAFVGQSYTYSLSALNNANPATWMAPNNIPPGLTLTPAGVLSGTPQTANYYTFYYTLNDLVDTVTACTSLSVSTVQITTPGVLPNATQNASYSYTVTAAGGQSPYTFSVNQLPNGLTINGATGLISGTVTQGPGKYAFYLTATDANHLSYETTVAINVIGVPATLAAVYTYGNFDDCTFGVNCYRPIGVNAGGVAPFTWTVTGLPHGMDFRYGGGHRWWAAPTDLELYGTPIQLGTFNVTATVTDANGATASGTFPLIVSPLFIDSNDYLPGGTLGVSYGKLMRVLGGASSPNYTAQVMRGILPDGLSLNGMTVSGTPLENGGFNPDFVFTDIASAGTLHMTENFSISGGTSTININQQYFDTTGSPTDILGYYTVGSGLSYQLFACCVPSYTWSQTGGTLPPGISLSASGLLSGTLASAGTYRFLVRAADSANPANFGVRQYTIVVSALGITTSNSLPYGNQGTTYSATFATNIPATFTLSPGFYLPPGLTLSSNGTISGTPSATGQYYFYVQAVDSSNDVYIRQYNLSIYPPGAYPPLSLPIGPNLGTQTLGSHNYQLTASGGVPPYHYSLTPAAPVVPGYRLQDGPPLGAGFSLTGGTGGFIGIIAAPGAGSTSLRVTDSIGSTFDQAVTLTGTSLHIVTASTPPNATLNTPYSFTFTGYGGNAPYTWSATNLPAGLTMNAATGAISGIPTGTGGTATITITDSTALSISVNYTINVDPFAIITGGVLPQGTINTAYSQSLSAPGCGSGCTWSIPNGGLPAGLSLNSATGAITGTPTGFSNDTFTAQASGSGGTVQKRFSLLIPFNTPQPLFITTTSPIGYTVVGSTVAQSLFVQGGTPPYTWSVAPGSTLPPGLTLQAPGETVGSLFNPGFTYLAGRVMQAGTGPIPSFAFTLQATDAAHNTTTQAYTFIASVMNLNVGTWPIGSPTPGTYGTTQSPLIYNTPYSQTQLIQGGVGPYTWSTPQAANPMPPGLALDSHTGIVSGTPANTGSFNSLIQVTDAAGNAMQQFVTFNIAANTASTVTIGLGPNLGIYASGSNNIFNINPSGGTPPYTITSLSALPPGCALETGNTLLSNANGTYDLSCSYLAAGSFTFTLQAQDSLGNIGVRTMNINVVPFQLYTTTALGTGSAGTPYSQQLLAWDNTATVTWTIAPGSALPPGMALCGATVCGTPTTAGNYSFTLAASDGSTPYSINYGFTLTISTIAITNPQVIPVQGTFNAPYPGYTFTATGGEANRTWSSSNLPAGLVISSGGLVTGTPTSTGSFNTTITVTDGSSTLSRLFTFYVNYSSYELTDTPVTLSDARVGQSYSTVPTPFGGTPPYTWALAPGSSLPPGLALYSGAALPPNIVPGGTVLGGEPSAVGLYHFVLIATDAMGSQVSTPFTLNVSPIAIESGALPNGATGTPYSRQLTVVGGTPPYTFTYSLTGINTPMFPAGVTASTAGLISGTPAGTGSYSFKATAADSLGNTYTTSYTLTVLSATGLQITTAAAFDLIPGRGYSVNLAASGGTAPYTWSVTGGSLPPGLSLIPGFSGAGTTGLAGNVTAAGTYSYTLHAVDQNGLSADRAYNITVVPMQVILPPSTQTLPVAVQGASYSYSYDIAGGTAPYTFAESPLYPLPTGMTLDANGTLHGIPQITGDFVLYFLLSDSSGYSGYAYGGSLVVTTAAGHNPIYNSVTLAALYAGVGVSHMLDLDERVSGGVPPFTWVVTPGSTLPAGLAIFPGTGNVPTYLGGPPAAAGTPQFSLTATDSVGQTTTVNLELIAQTVAISPDSVPNGVAGTPYSLNLTASGGSAPYLFSIAANSGMPPGLTLSSAGLLSGTPAYPGVFSILVQVIDQGGNTSYATYRVVIDNAAGQAPGIGINPASVQLSYVLGGAAPAPVPVTFTATNSGVAFFSALTGIPGASLAVTSGTGTTTGHLTLSTPGLAVGTYNGAIITGAPHTANQSDAIPVTLTVAATPACSYSIDSNGVTVPANSAYNNTFNVIAAAGCAWTVTVSDGTWITATGGGPGSGPVTYSLASNTGVNQRTGAINVVANGQTVQTFTITEFGQNCSYGINPATVSNLSPLATSITVNVTVSAGACPAWTATGLGAPSGSSTGNGSVTLAIPANNTNAPQTSTATVAGQTFTAIQNAASCTVSLSAPGVEVPAAGTGATPSSLGITIPAGCSYGSSVSNGVSIVSGGSGTGSGTLYYSVAPNSTTVAQKLAITVGNQTFNITEDPLACSVTVDASGVSGALPANGGGPFPILVNANGNNCSWTAGSQSPWVTLAPASGTGSGTVNVTLASNAGSTTPRTTTPALSIAGNNVSVTQAGTSCTWQLTSSSGTAPFGGGTGTASVVAPGVCGWSGQSNTSWLHITSSGSGGSGNVQFVVDPNPGNTPRSGTVSIAGATPALTYTVLQAPAPCSYTLGSTSSGLVNSTGFGGSLLYSTATAGCSPNPQSYAGWLHITSNTFSGTSGALNYSVDPNPNGSTRSSTIVFEDGSTYSVQQSGASCAFSLNAYSIVFGMAGGTGSVQGSPSANGCNPSVGTNQPAIVSLGALSGPALNIFTLPYTVINYVSATEATRKALITFGGQVYAIKQTSW